MIVIDAMRATARLIFKLLKWSALLVLLAAGFATARLAYAPVALTDWTDDLEAQVNASLAAAGGAAGPAAQITLGDASVWFDAENARFRLRLADLGVSSGEGDKLADIADASVKVDLVELLGGRFSVRAVEIGGAEALLVREPDGRFRFGLFAGAPGGGAVPIYAHAAQPAAGADGSADMFGLAARIADGMSGERGAPEPFHAFERLVVRDLNVRYEDKVTGRRWRAPNAMVDFHREEGGAWAQIAAELRMSDGAPAVPVSIEGRRSANGEAVTITAKLEGAPFAAVAGQARELGALRALGGDVSATVQTEVDLKSATFGEVLINGRLTGARAPMPEGFAPLELGDAVIDASYDPTAATAVLRDLVVSGGEIDVAATGDLSFQRDADLRTIGAAGRLALSNLRVSRPDLFDPALTADAGEARFGLDLASEDATRIELEALRLDLAATTLSARGQMRLAADGAASGALEAGFSDFSATRLLEVWPVPMAPGGRVWTEEHLTGGMIRNFAAAASFGGDQPDDLVATFDFEDLSGWILEGSPPIEKAVGDVRATLADVVFDFEKAQVAAPGGGVVRLDGSRFTIPDFEPEIPPGEARLRAGGAIADIARLIDGPSLKLMTKFGVSPTALRGESDGITVLKFPLAKDLLLADIDVVSDADLKDLRVAKSAFGAELRVAAAKLSLDGDGLLLTAPKARIDGRSAALQARETFSPKRGAARRQIKIETTVTADELIASGAPADALRGEARLALTFEDVDGRPRRFSGGADLTRMALAVPQIEWAKPRGVGAQATLQGRIAKDGAPLVEDFSVEGEGVVARGQAQYAETGALRQLEFQQLLLGARANMRLTVTRQGASGWRVTGGGSRLDLRGLQLGGAAQAAETEATTRPAAAARPVAPIIVDVSLAQFHLVGDAPFTNARMTAERAPDGSIKASLRGAAGGAPVVANLTMDRNSVSLNASADNAGLTLDALGLLSDATGGALRLNAAGPRGGPFRGEVSADGIVLRKVPTMLDAISKGLVFGVLDAASSGGLTFSTAKAPFTLDSKMIRIEDAVATGPSIGLTMSGDIQRESGALSLNGSISPAYAINRIPGEVPILGRLLTGGPGEGVLGVAFSIRGTRDAPRVSANPLSVLTPGIFRKIFSGDGGSRRNSRAQFDIDSGRSSRPWERD